ncbi:MAG: hypothetical protein ACHQII_03580 [Bacteroidia bacterium]
MNDSDEFDDFVMNGFFRKLVYGLLKLTGSFFRYLFLFRKYSYKQVLEQEYNGRVGVIVIFVLGMLSLYFYLPK